MDLRLVVDLLGKSPLFGSLAEPDRATIAGRMRRIDFEPNQMIFSRGDPGREIYLVLDGRVRLSVLTADGRELSFAHAGPGNVFGEIAALGWGRSVPLGPRQSLTSIVMSLPQKSNSGIH